MKGPRVKEETHADQAGIAFDSKDYVAGIWMVGGQTKDWMACIWVDAETGEGKMAYRFRYYNHKNPLNDAWSGEDRKVWTHGSGDPDGLPGMVETMHQVAGLVSLAHGMPIEFIPSGTGDEVLKKLLAQEWCHSQPLNTAADDPTVKGKA